MPIFVVARAIPMVRINRSIRSFCAANTCSTRAQIFDLVLLHERLIGRRPIGGIGPDTTRRIGLVEQSFSHLGALVGGRIGCRPFADEAEAAVDRDFMEWMPRTAPGPTAAWLSVRA